MTIPLDPIPKVPGLVELGNIDLSNRPRVKNPDGSISTVRTISIGIPQGEVLIPTVVGNRVVSDAEAIARFHKTGQHFGIYANPAAANAAAQRLHRQQASLLTRSLKAAGVI